MTQRRGTVLVEQIREHHQVRRERPVKQAGKMGGNPGRPSGIALDLAMRWTPLDRANITTIASEKASEFVDRQIIHLPAVGIRVCLRRRLPGKDPKDLSNQSDFEQYRTVAESGTPS